jgi:hypothetical protein
VTKPLLLIYLYDILGDMIKMTDVSSCVIAKCLNNGQTFTNRLINCNETADGFFCKSGIANLSYINLTLHVLMVACKTSKLRLREEIDKTQ